MSQRIELTDSEWMSIIDAEGEGLMRCCGNISELRDVLIQVARNGRTTNFITEQRLQITLGWCYPEHDVPSDAIRKVMEQVGFEVPDVAAHDPQSIEL